jgi:hypothetical protein
VVVPWLEADSRRWLPLLLLAALVVMVAVVVVEEEEAAGWWGPGEGLFCCRATVVRVPPPLLLLLGRPLPPACVVDNTVVCVGSCVRTNKSYPSSTDRKRKRTHLPKQLRPQIHRLVAHVQLARFVLRDKWCGCLLVGSGAQ